MLGRKALPSSHTDQAVISYEDCPAKTFAAPDGLIYLGRSTFNHCQIVGTVARELINRMPKKLTMRLFPEGAELAAAAHDIGKVSPYFYEKIRQACSKNTNTLPQLVGINPVLESGWGGHAGVSQVTARAMGAPNYISEILGQHHGFSPSVAGKRSEDEIFGGLAWHAERVALLEHLKATLGVDWPCVTSVPQARLLAGLTSVSDWIGSGQFFEDPARPWEKNIQRALDDAGFIPPEYKRGLFFGDIFGFAPREAQVKLIEQIVKPGVYILEAPMGAGKTEAALYAAYKMLSKGDASGIYFALPTQLTSNKIYDRFNEFLDSILSDRCYHRSLLLHGNAWLLQTEFGEDGRPGGSWFNHAKRGLLAPFAVGTIDQALMAAMNVKHGFVRAFGLAGKVVILDEVHTYDSYTGTILDALVELLRSLDCTVIILSATLSHIRREKLVGSKLESQHYPLITAAPQDSLTFEILIEQPPGRQVKIEWPQRDLDAVTEALDRASQGQQVLWIENTVGEAQQRFLDLAARAKEVGVECGLLHSRFTVSDRDSIEKCWVNLFGKHGWPDRNSTGRILVGTQVLEQSLDIDADFMVSRFVPTDMLLQRLGRLWRHENAPRNADAIHEVWVLAPNIERAIDNPKQAFGASAFVYDPYVLCRSLEVWQDKNAVDLPGEIRTLIEQTYYERQERDKMAQWLHELDNGTNWRKGRVAMQQLAKVTLSESGNTMPESKAQTRLSDADGVEVLMIKAISCSPVQRCTYITTLEEERLELPWVRNRLSKEGWRRLSVKLMRQIVKVRSQDAPKALSQKTLESFYLQHCFYLGVREIDESVLRVALVGPLGKLQGLGGSEVHDRKILSYSDYLGYAAIKKPEGFYE